MELLLLRHGQAEDHSPGGGDFSRALVEKGMAQARQAARILRSADSLPELVLTSPLVRARQTADSFTEEVSMPGAIVQSWLSCGMAPETALQELTAYPDFQRIMIVGHEPDFSRFIQYALGAFGEAIEVRKGSVTCLEISPPARRATLRFLLPHKLAKYVE